MKRTKIASFLMLAVVLAFSVMSFTTRFVDFWCFKYKTTATRPVTTTSITTSGSYDPVSTVNTLATCAAPKQVLCAFCISVNSPYWDGGAGAPKWTNIFNDGVFEVQHSSTATYLDPTQDGHEIIDPINGATGITPYYEENVWD